MISLFKTSISCVQRHLKTYWAKNQNAARNMSLRSYQILQKIKFHHHWVYITSALDDVNYVKKEAQ